MFFFCWKQLHGIKLRTYEMWNDAILASYIIAQRSKTEFPCTIEMIVRDRMLDSDSSFIFSYGMCVLGMVYDRYLSAIDSMYMDACETTEFTTYFAGRINNSMSRLLGFTYSNMPLRINKYRWISLSFDPHTKKKTHNRNNWHTSSLSYFCWDLWIGFCQLMGKIV